MGARHDLQPRHPNRLRPLVWGAAVALLLVPAVAMRFAAGVDWSAGDFVVAGVMLAAACGLYELATRHSGGTAYRAGAALAVLTGLLTAWVNLAVGMFGSEGDPLNLMFGGVLLVAAAGASLARLRARAMALAMAAAAGAQLLAVAAGLAVGAQGPDAREAALAAGFALPWLASALLFRVAAGAAPHRAG